MKIHYFNITILLVVIYFVVKKYLNDRKPKIIRQQNLSSSKQSPLKLAFLNLGGQEFEEILLADKTAISPLFRSIESKTDEMVKADVLFLYTKIDQNGQLNGSNFTLRQLIAACGAKILIVASENEGAAYMAAIDLPGAAKANIVMTIKRKGQIFTNFFSNLFVIMLDGISMPMAWVQIAPQAAHAIEHLAPAPETIFGCELGQVKIV